MRRKISTLILIFCFIAGFSIFAFTACDNANNSQTGGNEIVDDSNNDSETSEGNINDSDEENEENGKADHHYGDWVIEEDATCTENGTKCRTCTDEHCNEIETETIPALGHDIQTHEAKQATCIEAGWNVYEACARCDYSTKVELLPLAHN